MFSTINERGTESPGHVRSLTVAALIACSLSLVFVPATAQDGDGARWTVVLRADTQGSLNLDGSLFADINVGVFDRNWQQRQATAANNNGAGVAGMPGSGPGFRITAPDGTVIDGSHECSNVPAEIDSVNAEWTFRPQRNVALQTVHVSLEVPVANLVGTQWQADGQSGTWPAAFGQVVLRVAPTRQLDLTTNDGTKLSISFADPTQVLLQDNRQWGATFSVRIFRAPAAGSTEFPADTNQRLAFSLSSPVGVTQLVEAPLTITAGDDWIPLTVEQEIVADSALDFSEMGFHTGECGSRGRVVVRKDGHFGFERDGEKDEPRRFYGVNLCFGAQYLDAAQAAQLATRLQRLGYNALRIHHSEGMLREGQPDSLTFNPQRLAQLDALLAECFKRGIYVTTDLFVSRPVRWRDIGEDRDGDIPMDTFKVLPHVVPGAEQNWREFARRFLSHRNPHTRRTYAEEPGLAWLALINEGNLLNFYGTIRQVPQWTTAFNTWLGKTYRNQEGLAAAWGSELNPMEDPLRDTVRLPADFNAATKRVADTMRFMAETERAFIERSATFLRKELKCDALLTTANGWTHYVTDQRFRASLDYVDDHFYVDHPQFLQNPWQLPSRLANRNPIADGAAGGRHTAFTRAFGKPFCISEYNYSAPGRYRGVGGILTGALAARQAWDGVWRFAYSHDGSNLFAPRALNYFDMACDPLGQAAERASLCLFLRRDLDAAKGVVSIGMTHADLEHPTGRVPRLAADWHWAAWFAQVGSRVVEDGNDKLDDDAILPLRWASDDDAWKKNRRALSDLAPYATDDAAILALLKQRRIISGSNKTDPLRRVLLPADDQIAIDGPKRELRIATPRTAGGYAPAGRTLSLNRGAVEFTLDGSDATVWVSSLDDQPIEKSGRLLFTHLTDVQNSGIRYGEQSRTTLNDWGTTPHLVRAGSATVKLKLADAKSYTVYALTTGGRRLRKLPATASASSLEFTADVATAGGDGAGAVMLYEISRN